MVIPATSIIASYLLVGVVLSGSVIRFLGITERSQRISFCVIAFALAPSVISRILTYTLYALPSQQNGTYLVAVLLAILPLVIYSRNEILSLLCIRTDTARSFEFTKVTIFLTIFIAVCVFHFGVLLPYQSDISKLSTYFSQNQFRSGSWSRTSLSLVGTYLISALAVLTIAKMVLLRNRLSGTSNHNRILGVACIFLAVLTTAAIILTVATSIVLPVHENDALIYFKIATALFEHRDLSIYPLIPPLADGTWAATSHPLGYHGALLWSFIISNSAAPGFAKLVSIYHYVLLIALLIRFSTTNANNKTIAPIFSVLLFVTTPVIFYQFVGVGIDAFRLTVLVAMVFTIAMTLPLASAKKTFVLGACAGLAMNAHSINGITTPILVVVFVALHVRTPLSNKVLVCIGTGAVASLFGAERYVLNIITHGTPVFDKHILWELVPSLDYLAWRSHGIDYSSSLARWQAGALLGLTDWYRWGLGWWCGLISIASLFLIREKDRFTISTITASLTVFLFFSFIYLFHKGSGAYVLNYRYIMTAYPFICISAGIWIGKASSE